MNSIANARNTRERVARSEPIRIMIQRADANYLLAPRTRYFAHCIRVLSLSSYLLSRFRCLNVLLPYGTRTYLGSIQGEKSNFNEKAKQEVSRQDKYRLFAWLHRRAIMYTPFA